MLAGCELGERSTPELVWGIHGTKPGWLHKPRVAAFDAQDQLYIADLTDRIQVFDRDGKFLRGWRTPDFNVDGPSGLTVDRLGRLLVADTHFYRVLVYSRTGELLFQIGDGVQGTTPGRFGYPTDVVIDRAGNFYVARVRRERPHPGLLARGEVAPPVGRARLRAGRVPPAPGAGDRRPGPDLRRRQLQPPHPGLRHPGQAARRLWGTRGTEPGQMSYPYDLAIGPDDCLYVCEYGNHRVQKFTLDGKPLGLWGGAGPRAGPAEQPLGPGRRQPGGGLGHRLEQPSRAAVPACESESEPTSVEARRRATMLGNLSVDGRAAPGG